MLGSWDAWTLEGEQLFPFYLSLFLTFFGFFFQGAAAVGAERHGHIIPLPDLHRDVKRVWFISIKPTVFFSA